MKTQADAVVIGAGIQGLSAAYHLAKRGMRDVVVVEQAFIGAGTSGRSASMLMLQVSTDWSIGFSLYCYERYMQFEDEFGISPEFHRTGTLSFATNTNAAQEQEIAQLRQQMGIETHILTPDEIHQRWSLIKPDGLVFGVYGPLDGELEAQSIMLGYKDGAKRLGAEVYQGVQATGIQIAQGRVIGVETTEGTIACEWVVNAAGTQAAEVGGWIGLTIPIDNRLRNIYVTESFPEIPADFPFVYDLEKEWYTRREAPGLLVGMGKRKGLEAQMGVDWVFLPEVFETAMERIPILGELGIAHGWSGVRPLSVDGRPILGPVDGVHGFINNCCWGGEGVMHAPIGGQLVAEWICDGKTTTFDAMQFLLSRFDK